MSYEPLHHKYRPQTFADLVGQEAIATTLTNAIRTSKIAPAYLFSGSRGTGKTSSARILAKSLNCLESNKPTDQPCGVCVVCQGITNGSALDVIEIDAASNTGVDNIREIIERAQFAPVQCRYKVYVIDECHMLSVAAFNALLKTLEEPPLHVVFILATTDPQRVLPTIISRCQRFDFRRIATDAMVTHLRKIASLENINITHEAVQVVAQVSQGGLRDAESLLDQLSLLSSQVTVERVWDLVGSCSEPDLIELLQAIAANNPEAVLDCARQLMDRGREPITVLQNLAGFYRDLLIAKTASSRSDLVAITPPTWKVLCEAANSWDVPRILAGLQQLGKSEVQIKNTTQPRLWLELTLLGLLPSANSGQSATAHAPAPTQPIQRSEPTRSPTEVQPPSDPITPAILVANSVLHTKGTQPEPADMAAPVSQPPLSTEATPKPLASQEEPEQLPTPTTESSPAPAALEPTADDAQRDLMWQQVLDHLQPPTTQALLRQQCRLLAFDGAVARISINSQPLLKLGQGKLPNIEAAFQKLLQQKVKVSLEVAVSNQPNNAPVNEPRERGRIQPLRETESFSSHPMTPTRSAHAAPPPHYPITPSDAMPAGGVIAAKVPESPLDVATYASTTADSEDDEVAIAAQRLADFFKGEIIRLNLDPAEPQPIATNSLPPQTASEWYNADTENEADIDF